MELGEIIDFGILTGGLVASLYCYVRRERINYEQKTRERINYKILQILIEKEMDKD